MNDTSAEARANQLQVILRKSKTERLTMAIQMMEDVREMVLEGIKKQNPGISESDLKIEFLKRYYQNDLSADDLQGAILSIRNRYS